MKPKIMALLRRYLECAEQIADELRSQLGVQNLLAGVNSGEVPRRGICKSFGGGEYYIHGVGCRVLTSEIEIDFDFGPNGTLPGADPWKLFNFADAHHEVYPWLPEWIEFEIAVKRMIASDELVRLGLLPSPHLVRPA